LNVGSKKPVDFDDLPVGGRGIGNKKAMMEFMDDKTQEYDFPIKKKA